MLIVNFSQISFEMLSGLWEPLQARNMIVNCIHQSDEEEYRVHISNTSPCISLCIMDLGYIIQDKITLDFCVMRMWENQIMGRSMKYSNTTELPEAKKNSWNKRIHKPTISRTIPNISLLLPHVHYIYFRWTYCFVLGSNFWWSLY